MAGRLAGKTALIAGAGSVGPGWGTGKAMAVLFAREGARVLAVDRNPDAAEETRSIIAGEGGTCAVHQADVTDSGQSRGMIEACLAAYGRLDILVNNVGVNSLGGPVELAEAEWERVLRANLTAVYLACKHAIPAMLREGGGAIVNISSVAGLRWGGIPYVAYATSKGALLPLTRSVALQYAAQGIRANVIAPGLLETPRIAAGPLTKAYAAGDVAETMRKRHAQCPMGRMGDAWDIAHAALYLASDEARYVTGIELVVDGGLTARWAEATPAT